MLNLIREPMDSRSRWQQRRGGAAPAELIQLDRIVDEMRLKKSEQEIELMQIASNISAEAHTVPCKTVKPNMMEYALEAELNYIFGKMVVRLLTIALWWW